MVVIFTFGMAGVQPAFAAETADSAVHDIFTAKDNTPLEQFKARVLNRILYLDPEIDVSDLNIAPNDIQYTVSESKLTGIYAAREIVRQNPFYSTTATTGFPEFTYKDNGCVATVKYTYHPAWTKDFVEKVIAGYDEVMARIQPGDSDFAKILKIHDWIVKNVSYGMSTPYTDFAVGALGNRKAVCAGYAQCNQFLLSQVGIESIYVAANTTSEPHAWNLVKLDGHWFHVDCTWDRGLGANPNVNHTYFMLSDAELDADGTHTEDWKDPAKGYPTNNLCRIENKFYKDNKDMATDQQIAANPVTIQHEADPTQPYQANDREHWRTCPAGVAVGREAHDYKNAVETKATFTQDGNMVRKCTRCDETITQAIPKITAKLSTTAYTYSGKARTPSVICKGLTQGKDYTVSLPSGRKAVGKYTITVKGAGEKYTGSKTLTYVINPKGTGIKKPKTSKKAFTAKWSKQSAKMNKARITGYQVQYSLKKNFKSAKTVTVKGYAKTSKEISKLKKKKTYYVRVRTYMKSGGSTYYSTWSSRKSVKTK